LRFPAQVGLQASNPGLSDEGRHASLTTSPIIPNFLKNQDITL
jgi:hypothetical protein